MTAGDICTRNVVVAAKNDMLVDAAQRMRISHVGAVVIVESKGGRQVPIGIVTDRDIVVSVVAGDPDHLNFMLISDMMTMDLVTARENDTIEAAIQLMQHHGIRRLPIVDVDGGLVGILTLDDVLKYLTGEQSLLVGLMARERRQEREHRT
jgi:CBS domain-containing protein